MSSQLSTTPKAGLNLTQPLRTNASPDGRATAQAAPFGGSGGSLLLSLTQEAGELRKRVSACRALEDQIAHYQQLVQNEVTATRFGAEEYRARVDGSVSMMATLKAEVEAQRRQLAERKRANAELNDELRRT